LSFGASSLRRSGSGFACHADTVRASMTVSEAVLGLRRNPVMTAAAILTVAISLSLLGAALMLRGEIARMQDFYYTKIEVSVYLTSDITDAQRDSVRDTLRGLPVVKRVDYESPQEAYRRYLLMFKNQPALLDAASDTTLPESYRVKLVDPTQYAQVASALDGTPGVEEVVDQKALLDRLFGVLRGLRDAALALAAVQLLAAALLISNTIRVSAHARRRETSLMRLVGATRMQIQLPFLLEGVAAGAAGATAAVAILAVGKAMVLDRALRPLFTGVLPPLQWSDVVGQWPVLLASGVLLSAAASILSARRYVRT
ncbi:MAG: cell division transport system permease protein, partial [Verrucomicrobiota bacterium]